MPELIVEPHAAVELWTINGEARRNALSRAMVKEFDGHVQRVCAPGGTARVVVIRGAGDKAFCAGADLKERGGMSEADVRAFLDSLRRILRSLEQSDRIFIAYVNGAAFGGGTELALACDLRVISQTAEMGLTEVKLGIIPGGGGTQRLPRLIGKGAAKDLILTGRRVAAQEALTLGLVDRVGTVEDALALARSICDNAPLAVAAAKHAIDEGLALDLDEALALEQRQYELTLGTQDRLEGLKAFAEKRAPVFTGH